MKPQAETKLFRITKSFLVAMIVLLGLHQASWLNNDAHLIAGLPAGLAYHLGYCLLVALVLGVFVYRRRN